MEIWENKVFIPIWFVNRQEIIWGFTKNLAIATEIKIKASDYITKSKFGFARVVVNY